MTVNFEDRVCFTLSGAQIVLTLIYRKHGRRCIAATSRTGAHALICSIRCFVCERDLLVAVELIFFWTKLYALLFTAVKEVFCAFAFFYTLF